MTKPNDTELPVKWSAPALWFAWALDQFNLFDHAPRPTVACGDGRDIERWLPRFQEWLASGAGDRRKRTMAQCLLRSWNDQLEVAGAGDIWLEYAGMDDHNRRGVRTVLEHVRYF